MSQTTSDVLWEFDGRLPIISGNRRPLVSEDEIQTAERIMESAGAVLFRDFDISVDDFRTLTKRLGSSYAIEKWAPHAATQGGPYIGLHTEQAFLPTIPSSLWFYSSKPAERGGSTILCDGAAIFSSLSSSARQFLEQTDVLYWRRFSGKPPSEPYPRVLDDPPGIERNFRDDETIVHDNHYETTALCRPVFYSRHGHRPVFGNHILNTVVHERQGLPPKIDGFHQARLPTKEPLPKDLLAELQRAASQMSFKFKLGQKDMVWVDNTRFMHGRGSFKGTRQILALKAFHADQWIPGTDQSAYPSGTAGPFPVAIK